MALRKGKVEHSGDKASSHKEGFRGTRAAAKRTSKRLRRHQDKAAVRNQNASD